MTRKGYIKHVKQLCKQHGVKLTLANVRKVSDTGEGNGFFNDLPAELAVAMKQPKGEWLAVLIHEVGHLEQWINFSKGKEVGLWMKGEKQGQDVYALLDKWTEKKITLNRRQVLDLVRRIVAIELDCERKALRNINKHKLPIDPIKYTQQAYAYLFSYFIVAETRQWYDKEPYYNKQIVKTMPTKLNKDPEKEWKQYKDLMIKSCWKSN